MPRKMFFLLVDSIEKKTCFLFLLMVCVAFISILNYFTFNQYRLTTLSFEDILLDTREAMGLSIIPEPFMQNYDFVAFKKKKGWHFVNFPCHYKCRSSNSTVTVRFATNPIDIIGADVVLFSTGPFTLDEWEALQRYRPYGQVWIFATQEPAAIVPDFLPPNMYRYSSYNLSFTFHSTSDIHGAYGWYTPFDGTDQTSWSRDTDWYQKKPEFAVWVSSRHCGGLGWDRTKFVYDLSNYIPIDKYGTCGNMSIRRNLLITQQVFRKYKFHISLENSCCSEYLSEKVWNALERWNSIPIVLGGTKEEYQRLMPPHSFIHADDFSSIKELAEHIVNVSRDRSKYNEYFKWRTLGKVEQQSFNYRFPVFRQGACKVADKLSTLRQTNKVHSFDPYGPQWFGSCYRCGEHEWIQKYNFWFRRTLFSHDWEANRTLHWMEENKRNGNE